MADLESLDRILMAADVSLGEVDRQLRIQEQIVGDLLERGDDAKCASDLLNLFQWRRMSLARKCDRLMRIRARLIRE